MMRRLYQWIARRRAAVAVSPPATPAETMEANKEQCVMKQEYPKWLYHATKPAQIVADADKHAEAGPGWYPTPGEAAASASAPEPVSEPIVPADQASTAPIDPVAQEDAEAKSLYATPVPVLVEKLKDCSKEILERVQRLEAQNPKGARKGVLSAVEAQLAAQTVSG